MPEYLETLAVHAAFNRFSGFSTTTTTALFASHQYVQITSAKLWSLCGAVRGLLLLIELMVTPLAQKKNTNECSGSFYCGINLSDRGLKSGEIESE